MQMTGFRRASWTLAAVALAAPMLALALSTELPRPIDAFVRRAGIVIFAWAVVCVATYMLLSIYVDEWLDWIPASNRGLQYALALGSMALLAFAVVRYWQAYAFARLPSQLA